MKQKIGLRIYKDFKRPPKELVEKFAGLPTSNLSDCLQRMNCMRHEIEPFNDLPLLGVAFTVRVAAGDNLVLQAALDLAKPGDIIVVDGEGCKDRALMGEMMMTYAAKRGVAGFIIDGAVRDRDGLAKGPIPFYASAVTPTGPYKNGPGEINVPISCGGQVVFPGDILIGDADGILVVRPDYAEELAELGAKKKAGEEAELAARLVQTDNADMEAKHHKTYDAVYERVGLQYFDFAE